jgi:hypothetical protein
MNTTNQTICEVPGRKKVENFPNNGKLIEIYRKFSLTDEKTGFRLLLNHF